MPSTITAMKRRWPKALRVTRCVLRCYCAAGFDIRWLLRAPSTGGHCSSLLRSLWLLSALAAMASRLATSYVRRFSSAPRDEFCRPTRSTRRSISRPGEYCTFVTVFMSATSKPKLYNHADPERTLLYQTVKSTCRDLARVGWPARVSSTARATTTPLALHVRKSVCHIS